MEFIINSISCKNIAKWDGNQWEIFGSGANEIIRTIGFMGDSILIGGDFSFTGDTLAENIGLWYISPPPPPLIIHNNKPDEKDFKKSNMLLSVYPNPMTYETTVEFYLPEQGAVEIVIFDISGKQYDVLAKGNYISGLHKLYWKGDNYNQGTYICKMTVDEKSISVKFILTK
jgi:hypothetical protein